MCMDGYHKTKMMTKEGIGFKVFLEDCFGKLRSPVFKTRFQGVLKKGRWLKAEPDSLACNDKKWNAAGWHIFKSLSGAKLYVTEKNEVIHKVKYRKLIRTGYYNLSGKHWRACTAKEMFILEKIE